MIYERTQQGQYAAYDAASPLPRKLRSLLKVIDGKTATSVYVKSLESFGDVPKLLESLVMAGLIGPTSGHQQGSSNSKAPRQESSGQKTGFLSKLRQTSADMAGSTTPESPTTEMLTVRAENSSQWFGPSTNMVSSTQMSSGVRSNSALAVCVDEMSSFVLAHVPDHAFAILKELEEVADLEQLAIILGGYEQMIAPAGALAKDHVAHIKQLMRQAW